MTAFKIACDNGVAAGRAREKKAFIGVGAQVADLGNNLGLSLGLPYGVALQYRLADGPGWSPHIGLGLTGPHIGASYQRAPAAAPAEKKVDVEETTGEKQAFFGLFGKKPAPKPAAPGVDVNSPENIDLWQRLEAEHLAGIGKTHGDASDDDLRTAYLSALNHPDAAHLRGAPEFSHLRNSDASMNVDQLNHLMAQYLAPMGHTHASAMDAPSSKGRGESLWDEAFIHASNHPSLNHLHR